MLDTIGYKHTLRIRNNHCERAIMLRHTYTVCLFLPDMLTRVWQELEYRIDVCRVTRGAHIEHL